MNTLTKDEILWASFLSHEPTRRERKRRYLWGGFLFYLIMFYHFPKKALGIVLGIGFILATGYLLLRLDEIAAWVAGGKP